MFRKDIENIYTDTVREYLDNGYRIYYSTMGGSQGEIAKVDLTNDNEVIRILLGSKTEHYREHPIHKYMDLDYLTIIIGRNTDKLRGDSFSDIIWNEHLELISEIRFYKIGRKNNSFFGTKQEAIEAMCKYYDRLTPIDYWYDTKKIIFNSNKAKNIVLPFVKRQYKCKSITIKDIEKIEKVICRNKNVSYIITARGKQYKMRNHKIKLNENSF